MSDLRFGTLSAPPRFTLRIYGDGRFEYGAHNTPEEQAEAEEIVRKHLSCDTCHGSGSYYARDFNGDYDDHPSDCPNGCQP